MDLHREFEMPHSQPTHYNLTARLLHWITALAVYSLFGLGLWMVTLNYYSEYYRIAPHIHKSIGVVLAAIVIVRLIWRVATPTPAVTGSKLEVLAAHLAHAALYLLMLSLFISGYLISTEDGRGISVFNLFEIPSAGKLFDQQADIAGKIHLTAAWALVSLSVLHALAALKHHFVDKDTTLKKMLGVKS